MPYAVRAARRRPGPTRADGTPVRATGGIGGFADKVVVHQSMVATIPDDTPGDMARILGCAVTPGIGSVIHSAKVVPAPPWSSGWAGSAWPDRLPFERINEGFARLAGGNSIRVVVNLDGRLSA